MSESMLKDTLVKSPVANVEETDYPLFCYGTLMSRELRDLVIGEADLIIQPAVLFSAKRNKVTNDIYPAVQLTEQSSDYVEGLTMRCSPSSMIHMSEVLAKLDVYEGDTYHRMLVTVLCQDQPLTAWCYTAADSLLPLLSEDTWSLEETESEVRAYGGWSAWLERW